MINGELEHRLVDMSQKTIILLTLATFVVVPILCMGGLVQHACDCGHETACSHESACASDPCGGNALRGNEQKSINVTVSPAETECLTSLWTPEVTQPRKWVATEPPLPPDFRNLPYPPSDLPLLR